MIKLEDLVLNRLVVLVQLFYQFDHLVAILISSYLIRSIYVKALSSRYRVMLGDSCEVCEERH